MMTFYAFCRVIDDIADEDEVPQEQRRAELLRWKDGLLQGFDHPDAFQREVLDMVRRHQIKPELMAEIVDGVTEDLDHHGYETFAELEAYCYKVACVVGLVSAEIFGARSPASRDYAVSLGHALQLTNIIRDVGEDARRGRIYLPREALREFSVSEGQILALQHDEHLENLLSALYQRARRYYEQAAAILPREDRRSMMAAEMMAQVYSESLEKIRRKTFRVLHERIGLGKLRKLAILGAFTARGLLNAV